MRLSTTLALLALAASAAADTSWDHYGGGQHGQQYAALDQINTGNVAGLEELWRFRTGELGADSRRGFAFQANPILSEGRLYLPTATAVVFALDPATGKQLWRFDAGVPRSKGFSELGNRGVTAWVDPLAAPGSPCRQRILVGTLDGRLLALDGETGTPCAGFGQGGAVDLAASIGANQGGDINYTVTSPPVVVDEVAVVGSAIGDNRSTSTERGIVRGLDVRTGAERWRWDPVPRSAADPAFTGWQPDEARGTGAANAWAPLAADPALGLVYVPTGSASPDFYGGEREGDNRYANSVVALRAADGTVVWHQQLVHHDVWDYDVASQPTLVDLTVAGRTVPALVQGTKMGLVFTFDRRDGSPVHAVEERPVPQGGVLGEHLSPTQPFPVVPPPLVRHDPVTAADAWGLLVFDKLGCRRQIRKLHTEGIYTPPTGQGTLMLPGYGGGINWGGMAWHPEGQVMVTLAMDLPMAVALIPRAEMAAARRDRALDGWDIAEQAGTPFGMRRRVLVSALGVPCIKPPWGQLTAVAMGSGQILWQRPVGTIQDVAPGPVPNLELGMPGMGGPITTAGGLVFMAAVMDNWLRAFALDSGEELWRGRLPAGGQATPMTYLDPVTGRQVVVIAAGGHPNMGTSSGDWLVAFALPR